MVQVHAGWLDPYSYEDSISILTELALHHASLAGPISPILLDMLRSRDYTRMLEFEFPYDGQLSAVELVHARQAVGFFEKFEPLKLDRAETKTQTAFRKFAQTELTCKIVNDRFSHYRMTPNILEPFGSILLAAREKLTSVLGAVPDLAELDFSFGPGATTNVKRKEACPRVKLGEALECSSELLCRLDSFMRQVPALLLHHSTAVTEHNSEIAVDYEVRVVPGKLQFVPKNAKTYRTIIIEPGLNTLFQQGVGRYIRKRLRRQGIDLLDQTPNQRLAKEGSETNLLATVDLSSASDTIATQFVAFLLPLEWFELLAFLRTPVVTYGGLAIRLEKFSTMGNSFTFELESLIFYSLAWATMKHLGTRGPLSVYGDDIILPSSAFSLFEMVLSFCGFSVNHKKSYWNGRFRESCGKDYYLGSDIRPYYQKHLVTGETLFSLHNFYVRNGELTLAARVKSWIHPSLIIWGPDGYGDGHLIGTWVGQRRRVKISNRKRVWHDQLGWEGCFFETYRHRRRLDKRPHSGDALLPTYSIYTRGPEVSGEPSPIKDPQSQLWADLRHLTVPGSDGFEKISVYTLHRGVFLR